MDADRVTAGSQKSIGPYRIERELGRGGMGVVYLGRDTRLDRPVALKALPEELAGDPERLARFEREAKILASLNHPNIAAIHGIEEAEGRRYLALEYVEGVTLADRLAGGPLSIDDSIEIGIQLAAGMEAAHESSVIHRDLKPANIMLGRDDTVKILDFGLAKGRVATESDVDLGDSPTHAGSAVQGSAMTMPGVILGTAAYLSPEQAKGRPVDRRTDIWSFGCTLYECLTGTRAFHGETAAETIVRILEHDPDWTALPARTPAELRQLLQHCLEKDPRHRLRDVGDARLALEELRSGLAASRSALARGVAIEREPRAAGAAPRRSIAGWMLLAAALGALVGIVIRSEVGPRPSAFHGVARLSIEVPSDLVVLAVQLSPDGRMLAVSARPRAAPADSGLGGLPHESLAPPALLYLRALDGREFVPVGGTEGLTGPLAFSPDSRWIAFLAPVTPGGTDLRLMKIATRGRAPAVEVTQWRPGWAGLVWPRAEELVTQAAARSFVRIPAGGGAPSAPVPYQFAESTLSTTPVSVIPGGRGVLLETSLYKEGAWRSGTSVLDPRTGRVKILLKDGGNARATPTGHLVFSRSDAILAAPFDARRLELSGPPVAVLDGLRTESSWQPAPFGLGSDGTLVYAPGGVVSRNRRAVVVDTRGGITAWSDVLQEYAYGISVSPDGRRMAAPIPNARLLTEIWISDRGAPALRRVFSVPGADLAEPVWSPDGRRMAFALAEMTGRDGVYVADVDGGAPPRPVYLPRTGYAVPATPTSWSPDGSTLLVDDFRPGGADVVAVMVGAASRRGAATADSLPPARPVLAGPPLQMCGVFSPDGRRIAYTSNESGRTEVYVAPWLPDGTLGPSTVVSVGGGLRPRFAADSRTLYYVEPPSRLMAVALGRGPGSAVSAPRLAWDLDALHVRASQLFSARMVDLLPDGRLLAIQEGPEEGDIARLDVVLNFHDELRAGARGR